MQHQKWRIPLRKTSFFCVFHSCHSRAHFQQIHFICYGLCMLMCFYLMKYNIFCDSCICPALIISWVAWLARILYLQIRICVINRNKNYIGTLCVNLSFSFSLITPFLSCLIFNSALLKGYYIATYIYMFLAFFDNEIFFWRIQS